MKNQPPLFPNNAEFKKVDNPVSGEDSVESKNIDDGNSMKINPYRKAKGIWVHILFIV